MPECDSLLSFHVGAPSGLTWPLLTDNYEYMLAPKSDTFGFFITGGPFLACQN